MSNKTRWTPGPWRVREMGSEFFVEADGSPDMPYRLDVCGDDYTGHGDDEQRRHNFNLIAAAPELYEALEALLAECEDDEFAPHVIEAKAALAKARGE